MAHPLGSRNVLLWLPVTGQKRLRRALRVENLNVFNENRHASNIKNSGDGALPLRNRRKENMSFRMGRVESVDK